LGLIELNVTRSGYRSFFDAVEVVGPAWVFGLVTIVDHQSVAPDSTYVRVLLDNSIEGDEIRGWYTRDTLRGYDIVLDGVTDAFVSGKRISFLVQDIGEGGTIDKFGFGPFPWVISSERPSYFEGQLLTDVDLGRDQT
jgi:hypothetical protein